MRRKLLSFIVLMAMFTAYSGYLNLGIAQAAEDSDQQTIVLYVTSTITLTLATSTINLGTLTPGTPITGNTSLTVTTNDYNGFNLQVKRDDGTSTLDLDASPTVDFPDATAWNYSSPNSSATPGANLSFRLMETGTDAALVSTTLWGADAGTKLWAGFPSSNQRVTGIDSYVGAAQNVAYELRADAPATQQSGQYTGTVTFTAITNP
ncbi:MAG TPA: hypothetical protein P5230_01935 [Candidatus Magasanikbacteria bacterium]|nr:hypothetical protein [Candidatus Magasanikbacteria bacterium]